MKIISLVVALTLITACAYTPEDLSERTIQVEPLEFHPLSTNQAVRVRNDWWLAFGSAELNQLLEQLEKSNLTLEAATLRLNRAKLVLKQSQADNIPDLTGSASGRTSQDVEEGQTQHSSSGGLSLSYDFDIWGSRAARQLSNELAIDAQRYTNRSTALQVQGLLVSEYFNLLSLRERLGISNKNVDAAQQLFDLVKIRYEAGDASGVELSQQRNTLINAKNERLRLSNLATISQRAIGVLIADNTLSPVGTENVVQGLTLPNIELIQPAEILKQRPDVQLAQASLKQADIDVYQASVQGLPGLGLSGNLSVSDLLDLASNWTLGAALNSSATLFDGGRLRAAEEIAKTDFDLALNNYRQTTLTASQELLDALDNYRYQKSTYLFNVTSLNNNQRLYNLAAIRYKAGDTDFLNLLSAQRSWFSAQLAVVNSYEQALNAALTVYRSVGGAPQVEQSESPLIL